MIIESASPLAEVAAYAFDIHRRTAAAARHIPVGFDTAGGQFERADPYTEPAVPSWEGDDDRQLGRLHPP